MKIAFDVDGVVLNSIEVILNRLNEVTGCSYRPEHMVDWELERLGIDMNRLFDAVRWMYTRPIIEPYEGAVKTLSAIHASIGEPLLFITGRDDPATAERQLSALDWNGGKPEIYVTGGNRDKRKFLAEHGVEFIIEDDVKHLTEYRDAGVGVGLMVRPWNRSAAVPVDFKFHQWSDLDLWFRNVAIGKS